MNLSKNQQKYIDEMGGHAHNIAVEIIGELETETERARKIAELACAELDKKFAYKVNRQKDEHAEPRFEQVRALEYYRLESIKDD